MSSIQVFWSLSGKHAIQSSNHAISSNSFASGYLSPQALLITSVGGCCYSREIPVAKQKENRRRKIHAVRTHPKNDMKTATANKGGPENPKAKRQQTNLNNTDNFMSFSPLVSFFLEDEHYGRIHCKFHFSPPAR